MEISVGINRQLKTSENLNSAVYCVLRSIQLHIRVLDKVITQLPNPGSLNIVDQARHV